MGRDERDRAQSRGGWSWYTGSASWMYRLILESLLGLRLEVDTLHVAPCLPADWDGFTLRYRYRETLYHIAVTRSGDGEGGTRITLDDVAQDAPGIPLVGDQREHRVEVVVQGDRLG